MCNKWFWFYVVIVYVFIYYVDKGIRVIKIDKGIRLDVYFNLFN